MILKHNATTLDPFPIAFSWKRGGLKYKHKSINEILLF